MDGIGFDHAASGVAVLESGDEVILTSDGLMRLTENYQQCTVADIANNSLHETFRRLREFENDPEQEISFTKKSDDVFAMRFVAR